MKITGTVIKGQGIGKKLDLPPTMNIEVTTMPSDLSHGIYAVRVETTVGRFDGVAHYGPRPAVKAALSFEVHCFGLNKDLYGTPVSVEILDRIRDVQNFSSIDLLREAIKEDIRRAKEVLCHCEDVSPKQST